VIAGIRGVEAEELVRTTGANARRVLPRLAAAYSE
jgi:TatD DNase family protein